MKRKNTFFKRKHVLSGILQKVDFLINIKFAEKVKDEKQKK